MELRSTDYTGLVKKTLPSSFQFSQSGTVIHCQGTEREKAKGDEGWDVGESSDQFLGCESRRFIGGSPLRLSVDKLTLALLKAEDG